MQITYSENFKPEGCKSTSPGVTMGVSLIILTWNPELTIRRPVPYSTNCSNLRRITASQLSADQIGQLGRVVAGSLQVSSSFLDPDMTPDDSWQGGGHSMLSNNFGLGADRVLQYRVVTPQGKTLTANACQNVDLFYALRGGGGGTFGVVMESTFLAEPRPLTIQVCVKLFWSIFCGLILRCIQGENFLPPNEWKLGCHFEPWC